MVIKKGYERRKRVAKAIQREIATMLWNNSIKDDRISGGLVSIVDVEMNTSLSSAQVFFSIMDPDLIDDFGIQAAVKAAFDEHSGAISGNVARQINLKYAPRLHFVLTESLKDSVKLINLIDKAVESDEANHG
ncbi:MAG: 30S ribosome-binding factor RbfA [Candidatus Caenarcaniphilales bacterium]|nr:30S ribosome-binding factor RbfA [Candidatus Caenarcaniphilales bacterium]